MNIYIYIYWPTLSLKGLQIAGGLMGLGLGAAAVAATENSPSGVNNGATPSGPVVGLSGPPVSSLENLLGNIQNLLRVATESVRHEERQKGEEIWAMVPHTWETKIIHCSKYALLKPFYFIRKFVAKITGKLHQKRILIFNYFCCME